jgi:hypothetical protein
MGVPRWRTLSFGVVILAMTSLGVQGASGAVSPTSAADISHSSALHLHSHMVPEFRWGGTHFVPRVVPQHGGRVTLSVTVAGATTCTFSDVGQALALKGQLPKTVPCGSSHGGFVVASVTLKIPAIATAYCGIFTQELPLANCDWNIDVTAVGSSSKSIVSSVVQLGDHCRGMCFFSTGPTTGMMSWPSSYEVAAMRTYPVSMPPNPDGGIQMPSPGINGQYYRAAGGVGLKEYATGCFTILVVSVLPAAAWRPWTCTSGVAPPSSLPPIPSPYT